jgi:hypothetical protein
MFNPFHSQKPFALSLSKGCLIFAGEGQGFDKLSPIVDAVCP